ncbi:hypothetical protein ASD53_15335 [Lysobacter sp. Root559]|uniref:hypothetical protein n=1 Tax=Lysobacter sp. Root559 TaxID=1736559 RepID=UPI000700A99C|nr:hypothetical protein [Lysobacter sp. Root559]KQZ55637.1 hypothetical protein ASD53_15335 [Lysobacter sp. Root559]
MFDRSVRRKAWTMLCLTGLALSGSACSVQNERPTATTRAATEARADPFAGDWGFSTRCYKGHYVGITLKREGDRYTGSWSDGTDIRGSNGLLKGRASGGKLVFEVCSNYVESGSYAQCPKYEGRVGYFERRGGQLVWYRQSGDVIDEYAILDREPIAGVDPEEICNE